MLKMENPGKQLNGISLAGGIATIIVLAGILADMITGAITGGDLSSLPQTAIGRFEQFRESTLLGLYNLDLLNVIIQIIMIVPVFAIYAVHKNEEKIFALLSLVLFLVGTTIFVSGNTALTMLDLSREYYSASSGEAGTLIAAAGEAMLAKGEHGGSGVFIGFALPLIANILLSVVMLKGRIFSKTASCLGITGNSLMLIYTICITFIPQTGQYALAFAMPGGLLVMTWMILFSIKLFKMRTA